METTADAEGFFEVRFQLAGRSTVRTGGTRSGWSSSSTVAGWRKGKIEGTRSRAFWGVSGDKRPRRYGGAFQRDERAEDGLDSGATMPTRGFLRGLAAFYRALQAGPDSKSSNPVFYVSSSPWNIYDMLVDFLNDGVPLTAVSQGLEP